MANLELGISNRKIVSVAAEHSPGHLGSTVVLSTPDMIRLMEEVCTAAIQPLLDPEDQTSVGVHVDVSHENAAREGEDVEVSGELVRVLADPPPGTGWGVAVVDLNQALGCNPGRTRVGLDRPKSVDVVYHEGPFRHLTNHWTFEPDDRGNCIIDFYIDFEFRSRTLQKLIGKLFNEAVQRMVNAFEKRARSLYGPAKLNLRKPGTSVGSSSGKLLDQ